MSLAAAFVVGIDLGTTNTVVAWAPVSERAGPAEVLPIPQLVTATETAARPMLPSVLYAPLDAEAAHDPWTDPPWTGGEYARRRGTDVPGREVASAKSWLAHDAVDRRAAILPWGGNPEQDDAGAAAPRISPVDASARYLEHVRRAWDAAHPGASLADQEVVLTVPASFDATARELTLEAARAVGLSPRLLEEPTAAFYDWMNQTGKEGLGSLLERGEDGALVLVCDVGGGTTDLSLIRVAPAPPSSADPADVTRLAVGRHLLLGGDNMDLALAHACEGRLSESRLDPARFAQLVAACRDAKERLLGVDPPEDVAIAIAGTGARLVGATLTTKLTRAEVETIVLEGFWPRAGRDSAPTRARGGLVAFGLPYERDGAITRHVASFFARHTTAPAPDALLLNGGVFRAGRLGARLVESIASWGGPAPRLLDHPDPDLAVARGAVAFALARRGGGVRIGGGSSRGYYVEVAAAEGAERRAVCVVPRGAREGAMHVASSRPLALVVGRPARFDLWASDETAGHRPGDVVVVDDDRYTRLPPVAATFPPGAGAAKGETLRVALEGETTEVGTLDLACVELEPGGGAPPRRFRLTFELRGAPSAAPPPPVLPRAGRSLESATLAVARVYGKGRDASGREVKDLVRDLERHLGERERWDTATSRALFDALAPGRSARRRSADHERVFWQLAGFCLRPGFGDPGDVARIEALAPLAAERLAFPEHARAWQQFWIAWRRVAGGLDDARQAALRDLMDPWLAPPGAWSKKPKGARPLAEPEMLDAAASLERVTPARRAELGGWILERTWTDRDPRLWAALGRLGARVPAYASVDHVVAPHVAERWLDHLLREKWDQVPTAADAAVRLARFTSDRARDLPERLRVEVARRLAAVGATTAHVSAMTELVTVEQDERATFWGESLPPGLRLA